ncbi:MAG TPA: MXAN_2562 family outer membrane beta-barrel protein [Myxococcales bacterium]|nr:MXAN_2562 family outer membrane beta-barrel protein [Myxococcales bacterium]
MRLASAPALSVALVLAPFAASALTFTVNNGTNDILVGAANCRSLNLVAAWDLQVAPTAGVDHILLMGVRNASTCSVASPSPEITFRNETPTAQTGQQTVSANELALADAGTPGCDNPDIAARSSANPITDVLCLQYTSGGTVTTGAVNVKYALAPPLSPQGVVVTPGNQHLKVSWSKGNDAETIATYDVHVTPAGVASDGGVAQVVTTTNADVQRTDDNQRLQNDAGYAISIVAHDTYGNVSAPSAAVVGTPVPSSDFYDHYRNEGGSAEGGGGCATGGASAWIAAIALGAALLLRRRRNARNGAALIALLSVAAPSAQAAERHPTFLVGFKVDRYDPKIDSEPGLTGTPYHDVYGGRAPLRYQLELDWEVAHPFGSILVGATVGYWQNLGKALLLSSTPGNLQHSGDTTLLDVIPFGVIATYRFDWLAQRWERFPFIPYAQVGLMRALWISYDGTGSVSNATAGGRGSGWTNGYTTALGFAINLNAIDLDLAREAYLDTGIQRTSLFAEYGWTYLSNFHKSGALILSDHAWRFGVSVEF